MQRAFRQQRAVWTFSENSAITVRLCSWAAAAAPAKNAGTDAARAVISRPWPCQRPNKPSAVKPSRVRFYILENSRIAFHPEPTGVVRDGIDVSLAATNTAHHRLRPMMLPSCAFDIPRQPYTSCVVLPGMASNLFLKGRLS